MEKVCSECKLKEWKYKCPGCSVRSCSLSCVKTHKLRTLCTGKRNRTQFLPISQFDDNRLLSDYNLLEEIRNASDCAKRLRTKLSCDAYFKLPFHLKALRTFLLKRRTALQFLPSAFSRRHQNNTRYHHRNKCVYWTIEWRFHSTNIALLDHQIDENMSIASVVEKHLKPGPWSHPLKKFCDEDLNSLNFFIRKYPKLAKAPMHKLDVKAPLRQQLENKEILEYPVVYVFLSSHAIDFEVVKQDCPVAVAPKPQQVISESNNCLSPRGIPFKEEEIEEDDTRVFDLVKHENSSERALASRVQSSTEAIEQVLFNDVDFDFDQGLIDAYSNLIAEINPDDFLDFEGLICKQEITEEERIRFADIEGELFAEEDDLEEGEIVE